MVSSSYSQDAIRQEAYILHLKCFSQITVYKCFYNYKILFFSKCYYTSPLQSKIA